MPTWSRVLFFAGLLGVLVAVSTSVGGCGNGVPVERSSGQGSTGSTCSTNDDCATGAICVHAECVAFGSDFLPASGDDAGSNTPEDLYCQPCQSDSDCGGTGNYCLTARSGEAKFCGTACQSDSDCHSGARCFIFTGLADKNCYPAVASCDSSVNQDGGTSVTSDAGHPDAGTPDAGHPDAGTPDAGTQTCTTDTWSNFAENLIVTECIACHSHTHRFSDSYSSVKNNSSTIRSEISRGSMPQYPQSITSTEKTRILKWIDCGLPQ